MICLSFYITIRQYMYTRLAYVDCMSKGTLLLPLNATNVPEKQQI